MYMHADVYAIPYASSSSSMINLLSASSSNTCSSSFFSTSCAASGDSCLVCSCNALDHTQATTGLSRAPKTLT